MDSNDFKAFCLLMHEVHLKVFYEAPRTMNFARARALSEVVFEVTGCWISYKSLKSFTDAVCTKQPESINPRDTTLAILVSFLQEKNWKTEAPATNVLVWYKYRGEKISAQL